MECDSYQLNRTSLGYKVRPCRGPGWAVGEGNTQKPARKWLQSQDEDLLLLGWGSQNTNEICLLPVHWSDG